MTAKKLTESEFRKLKAKFPKISIELVKPNDLMIWVNDITINIINPSICYDRKNAKCSISKKYVLLENETMFVGLSKTNNDIIVGNYKAE